MLLSVFARRRSSPTLSRSSISPTMVGRSRVAPIAVEVKPLIHKMYLDDSLRRSPPFMHTCRCGIGSSPADHHHFHKHHEGKPSSGHVPPKWLLQVHEWTDKCHTSVPLALSSIAIAVMANFAQTLLPFYVTQPLLASVFITLGVPAITHTIITGYGTRKTMVSAFLDVHTLMTFSAFAALALGNAAEGAFLLGLFQLAHAIQHRMVQRAKRDFNSLANIIPDTVQVMDKDTGVVTAVDAHNVSTGTRVIVRPGSVCPIDGALVSLHCSVNVAHITGESMSIEKTTGEVIPGGAINVGTNSFEIETVQIARESTLQRIVNIAQSAAYSRLPIASAIDQIAPKYSTIVLGGTAAVAAAGPLILGWTIQHSIYTALGFLVAASPCALLVAVPVAQAAAVSACSRRGIVLSGGASAIPRFASAQSLAVDKTGTITLGELEIVATDCSSEHFLEIGAALAFSGSQHPVSRAIATRHNPTKYQLVASSVEEIPGQSVSGIVVDLSQDNRQYKVEISRTTANDGEKKTTSIIKISTLDNDIVGTCTVELEDKIRDNVSDSLAKSIVPVYMLTGDNVGVATLVANKIGLPISQVFASMSPSEKADKMRVLPRAMMVGDGINDAPALASAPAGGVAIATSANADSIQTAAVSVADAVIIADKALKGWNPIDSANYLIQKSKQTDSIIKTNIGLALVGMTGTAAAVIVGGCPLWLAVILHEGSTVLVVLNSLRNLS